MGWNPYSIVVTEQPGWNEVAVVQVHARQTICSVEWNEVVLYSCIAKHKDNNSSFQNCWQESYMEEMYSSSIL